MSNQEREEQLLYEMMPHVATQVRLSLAGIYVAAARLAPAEERARDPELDKNAAGQQRTLAHPKHGAGGMGELPGDGGAAAV